jgi:glycosyltransferase involved in cell wall biosynthesis
VEKMKIEKVESLVSVIIPIFNKEKYLLETVDSVLKQTYQNFEVIAICDPSTDNSTAIMNTINDSKIKVYCRNKPGSGGYAARNLGISKANGEWIAFIDADDTWEKDHLEQMIKSAKKHPDTHIFGCSWLNVNEPKSKLDRFSAHTSDKSLQLNLKEYLTFCLKRQRPLHTSIVFLRNSNELKGIFPENTPAKRGGDVHAWLTLMCKFKRMVWCSHIGAQYKLGVAGQVISSAPPSTFLMSKNVLNKLSLDISQCELTLLAKYLNQRVFVTWMLSYKLKVEIDFFENLHKEAGHIDYIKYLILYPLVKSFLAAKTVLR